MVKKHGTSGKGSNFIQMLMVAMTVVVLTAISLNYYLGYLQKAKVSTVFVSITELQTKLSEERSNGKRWKKSDWEMKKYATDYTQRVEFSNTGVIMVQFNSKVKNIANKWIFFVPAIRMDGSQFAYLDLSHPDYDMTRPMFWICGIPQTKGVPPADMNTDCRTILGPEYQPPD